MPDPGEPGGFPPPVNLPTAAARLPDATGAAARVVHLVQQMPGSGVWVTVCPADVDGLPAFASARLPTIVHDEIDCRACVLAEPGEAAEVDGRNMLATRRRARETAAVRTFFRWTQDTAEVDFVPAAYADGVLQAMHVDTVDELVELWDRARPLV